MKKTKHYHRWLGLLLLLPLLGWVITGTIFLLKPGYQAAYEQLEIKKYPLGDEITINSSSQWTDFQYFKTVLGKHLLVKTNNQWHHLDPLLLKPKIMPTEQELLYLFSDAISHNLERYGSIVNIKGGNAVTDSGIEISLDWQRMQLKQQGSDTFFINNLYKIHYLQWTGNQTLDRLLAVFGLITLFILAMLGLLLAFRKTESKATNGYS